MPTLLVKNIALLATFDDARREIKDGVLLLRDNVIERVGTSAELAGVAADRVLDLSGHIVMPGMVNTHHHMYQNLTRVMVQDDELFVWLTTLYPIWAKLDDEAIYVSARVAMAELIQSGCTTSSDHLYVLPNNSRLDSEIRAAQEIGMRFHAARGAMSRGQSQGGLPPDSCVEKEDAILKDAERVIHEYHDASRHAMSRIILAPCSPFSVTPGLMKEAAQLARAIRACTCTRTSPKTSTRRPTASASTACARSISRRRSIGSAPTSGSRTRSSWTIVRSHCSPRPAPA